MLESMQFFALFSLWPIALILLGLILLQGGAGDVSSSFGGGGRLDSTLGVGASAKMSKITGVLVALFLILVVVLAMPVDSSLGNSFGGEASSVVPTEQNDSPALINNGDDVVEPVEASVISDPVEAAPVEAAPVEVAPEKADSSAASTQAPAAGVTLE